MSTASDNQSSPTVAGSAENVPSNRPASAEEPGSKRPKTGDDALQIQNSAQETSTYDDPVDSVILTFSMDHYSAYFQILPHQSIRQLVRIAFEVCDPRDGDTDNCHLWTLTSPRGMAYDSHPGRNATYLPFHMVSYPEAGEAPTTVQEALDGELQKGTSLQLKYDYGSTSHHILKLRSVDDNADATLKRSDFPRRRPEASAPAVSAGPSGPPAHAHFAPFTTAEGINLKESFPNFDKYVFDKSFSNSHGEVNLFQAGRRQVHAFLERRGQGINRMVFFPDKPKTLSHYLQMLDTGASIEPTQDDHGYPIYNWQSVVVIPENHSKRSAKFLYDLEEGFCDCEVVPEPANGKNWDSIFPKTAAFAGFSKDKQFKHKGFIRYNTGVLEVISGSGSPNNVPKAPRGTAYEGRGCHVPAEEDTILFRVDGNFDSIHDLFCKVEALLRTLK